MESQQCQAKNSLLQNLINHLAQQAPKNPSAQLPGVSNFPAGEPQGRVTANNLITDSIQNPQQAASTLQLQQLQAEPSFANDVATTERNVIEINLLAQEALKNLSARLPGANSMPPNLPARGMADNSDTLLQHIINLLAQQALEQNIMLRELTQPKMPETVASRLLDQLNAAFPSVRQSQGSITVATQPSMHSTHQSQDLNISRLSRDPSSNLTQMPTVQANPVNDCVNRETTQRNNDESNLNGSASAFQDNVSNSISNLQTTHAFAQSRDVTPSVASNQYSTVASLVAAVLRELSDALPGNMAS